MKSTIERLVPDEIVSSDVTGSGTLLLHLERYEFAAKHVRPGRLLDAASGVGYGTHLIATQRPDIIEAIGIDISGEAISYGQSRYGSNRIRFEQHDVMTFEDEKGLDSIVSIETIEHVPDPVGLIKHLVDLLKPGGRLVASVPTTPSVDVNPYHVTDFTERSFRAILSKLEMREVVFLSQIQPYPPVRTIRRAESRLRDLRGNLLGYYFEHPMAMIKRLLSTIRYGFANRYLTVVWEKVRAT